MMRMTQYVVMDGTLVERHTSTGVSPGETGDAFRLIQKLVHQSSKVTDVQREPAIVCVLQVARANIKCFPSSKDAISYGLIALAYLGWLFGRQRLALPVHQRGRETTRRTGMVGCLSRQAPGVVWRL